MIEPFSYISGQVTRVEYLTRYRPEYKVIQYANTTLPETAKILCIFMGRRGYYIQPNHIFEDNIRSQWLLAWLGEPGMSETEIAKRFKEHGITHIMLRTDLFLQWLQQNLTLDRQNLTAKLAKDNFIPLFSNLNYSLYKIKI
ncbi:hypothetical protein JCM39068_20880 [Desulfocastanea catecholica]